jgi:glycosyltransferase involved in cell wall biosynthesis
MAVQGAEGWEVTAVAPVRLHGDLRPIELEPLSGEACRLVPIDMRFGSHPHLRMYGAQLRSLLHERWDVVHCWEEPYVLAAAQVAHHVRPPTRFVPATFQNIAKRYPLPVKMIEHRVMRRADAWIAFGQTVHQTQSRRPEYVGKPARVVNPGVDTEAFHPDSIDGRRIRETLGWRPEDLVVGFIGRLVEEKGIETIVHAFVQSTRGWKLLVVGAGVLAEQIESLACQRPSQVKLVRNVGHNDVPAYLRAMDLLCAPSRTRPHWKEQFGRMLIEAMACGVPVLASASGEIPHVLSEAGVLIPEDDLPQWTATIDRLLADPGIRRDLATRGLARARTEFSWPVIARRHLDFFAEVLAQ